MVLATGPGARLMATSSLTSAFEATHSMHRRVALAANCFLLYALAAFSAPQAPQALVGAAGGWHIAGTASSRCALPQVCKLRFGKRCAVRQCCCSLYRTTGSLASLPWRCRAF